MKLILVTFVVTVMKMQLKGGRLTVCGFSPSWEEALVIGHIVSSVKREENNEYLYPGRFLLFMKSRTQAQGMVSYTFSVGLPTSVNPIKIIPHSHSHRLTQSRQSFTVMSRDFFSRCF